MSSQDKNYEIDQYRGILSRAHILDSENIENILVKSSEEDKRKKIIDVTVKPGTSLDFSLSTNEYEVEKKEKDEYVEVIVSKNYEFHLHKN